ncbi:MAG: iron-containing alcohol dehydrogenase family protein [Firmicutes bacterium]|nr:iron-containing alcohol dehydrogenase family protein [Bacillota bacterium]
MKNLKVSFPNYMIGEDALKDLDKTCLTYGKNALIVGGKTALRKVKPKLEKTFEKSELKVTDYMYYGGECTYKNIEKIAKRYSINEIDMIIGVGGGKALDTAKGAADILNIPAFTVPTIAATCAATTSLSVVYTEKGDFHSFKFLNKPPICIFIDSEIISKAPKKYLWAGIGDTMAKHYESTFASRGDKLDHSCGMGIEISSMCVKPMLEYGHKALLDCKEDKSTFEIKQVILNNIISTGLVSMLVKEEYNGAIAHSLFYGLTILEHIENNHLHGEVVAYGVLVQLAMDDQREELHKLIKFYKGINLPTSLQDIGVKKNREYLEEVLEATVKGPDMKYLPYKVSKDMIYNAIEEVENIN